MEPRAFIFIGRSGAGKGTQVKLLEEYLGRLNPPRPVLRQETGNQTRTFIAGESETARRARALLQNGALQPGFLVSWLWSDFLIKNFQGEEHIIFDGTPRSLLEAENLDSALVFYRLVPASVILLSVDEEVATERLKQRGRADDLTPDGILKRLAWYETDVVSALNYYRDNSRYCLEDIDGGQTMEKVHADIVSQLKP